ncbi:hypothetical protein JHW43_002054 [Diplocarpon mali]|nr:hypothetical protein JHW43_002054 [Diplocarpon mali]
MGSSIPCAEPSGGNRGILWDGLDTRHRRALQGRNAVLAHTLHCIGMKPRDQRAARAISHDREAHCSTKTSRGPPHTPIDPLPPPPLMTPPGSWYRPTLPLTAQTTIVRFHFLFPAPRAPPASSRDRDRDSDSDTDSDTDTPSSPAPASSLSANGSIAGSVADEKTACLEDSEDPTGSTWKRRSSDTALVEGRMLHGGAALETMAGMANRDEELSSSSLNPYAEAAPTTPSDMVQASLDLQHDCSLVLHRDHHLILILILVLIPVLTRQPTGNGRTRPRGCHCRRASPGPGERLMLFWYRVVYSREGTEKGLAILQARRGGRLPLLLASLAREGHVGTAPRESDASGSGRERGSVVGAGPGRVDGRGAMAKPTQPGPDRATRAMPSMPTLYRSCAAVDSMYSTALHITVILCIARHCTSLPCPAHHPKSRGSKRKSNKQEARGKSLPAQPGQGHGQVIRPSLAPIAPTEHRNMEHEENPARQCSAGGCDIELGADSTTYAFYRYTRDLSQLVGQQRADTRGHLGTTSPQTRPRRDDPAARRTLSESRSANHKEKESKKASKKERKEARQGERVLERKELRGMETQDVLGLLAGQFQCLDIACQDQLPGYHPDSTPRTPHAADRRPQPAAQVAGSTVPATSRSRAAADLPSGTSPPRNWHSKHTAH